MIGKVITLSETAPMSEIEKYLKFYYVVEESYTKIDGNLVQFYVKKNNVLITEGIVEGNKITITKYVTTVKNTFFYWSENYLPITNTINNIEL